MVGASDREREAEMMEAIPNQTPAQLLQNTASKHPNIKCA